jgi:energy-coupling factor transporter ATP-binding protein EcfA2
VGVILPEPEPEPGLSVQECLALYAGFYRAPRDIGEIIALAGLTEKAGALGAGLSGGQRRRLDFALALIGDPELIFLDEPATGFDPSARRAAWEVVAGLRQLGKTVFLTTHDMDEAEYLAGRITVLCAGHIVAEGTPGTRAGAGWQEAGSCQGLADEGGGELLEVAAGGVGELAQGPLPGEHGQPVHRGPDGVLDARAALPAEHAGVGQFVEDGAELIQGRGVLPGPAVGSAVGVLVGQGERGGEQPCLLAGELQVGPADRAQPAAGRGGIAVLAAHAAGAGGHAGGELAHGRSGDRGQELVPVGEVPVGGVRHHAHHPCRLAEHDGVRAAGPGQLEPCGDQAVADGTARVPPPGPGYLTC